MNVILFDHTQREALYPIVFTRPVSSIRVGMLSIQQKWESLLNVVVSTLVPDYLSAKFPSKFETEDLYINASVLPSKPLIDEILKLNTNQKLVKGDLLLAFYGEKMKWEKVEKLASKLEAVESESVIVNIKNTWDIISLLKPELQSDFNLVAERFTPAQIPSYTTAIERNNIWVGANVKLGACILNATEGEIVIDDDAEIMDGAMVKGPVYLGKHSCIKMGAKIYGPVSVGEHCKLGGEVCDSILQAYSNKGHDGFLGHSYLGEWCNLGADTNTSNLKNTYEPVRLWNYSTKKFDRTGMQFLGLIMGDHSKTGINTMLNTGTVIGVACNVYGGGFPRNFIPDFSMGSSHKMEKFPLKKVFEMAGAMMQRRKIEFSHSDEEILTSVFEITKEFRK